MKLTSYGAAETVTGSCHLLEITPHFQVLIDCGLFQGHDEEKNLAKFEFDPSKVKLLLITHAHLDHVGRIPKLVQQGFHGRIVTTRATMDLTKIVLLDSAKLMEEDYKTRLRKAKRRGEEHKVTPPYYTKEDVEAVFDLDIQYAKYDHPTKLTEFLTATYRNAGHILGSATITLEVHPEKAHHKGQKTNPHQHHTLVFSGDLGNKNDPVLPPPTYDGYANHLFIESTYGDRNHKNLEETVEEFKTLVTHTLKRHGNVIIPSFAIERTQEILCILKQMTLDQTLPPCQIFVDSPMATKATRVYDRYLHDLSPKCQSMAKQFHGVFEFPSLTYTESSQASQKINAIEKGAIIIAGSGMCTGGRILHHFKHRLWNERNTVIFVGYQAQGTLGRKMIEGAKFVKIYGEEIIVKAKVASVNGFSAHADQSELIDWMHHFKHLGKIHLIHGEPDKQAIFQQAIQEQLNHTADIVKFAQPIKL